MSKIFEPEGVGWEYPVVTHIFTGRTLDEAMGYYRAHLESDAFLRQCSERGSFEGQFSCVQTLEVGY